LFLVSTKLTRFGFGSEAGLTTSSTLEAAFFFILGVTDLESAFLRKTAVWLFWESLGVDTVGLAKPGNPS
jgi:hypothetical protein